MHGRVAQCRQHLRGVAAAHPAGVFPQCHVAHAAPAVLQDGAEAVVAQPQAEGEQGEGGQEGEAPAVRGAGAWDIRQGLHQREGRHRRASMSCAGRSPPLLLLPLMAKIKLGEALARKAPRTAAYGGSLYPRILPTRARACITRRDGLTETTSRGCSVNSIETRMADRKPFGGSFTPPEQARA